MTSDVHLWRACCADRYERDGAAAPLASADVAPWLQDDATLPTIPLPRVRERRLAVHEAAHVVAAVALGSTPTGVSIDGAPVAYTGAARDWRASAAISLAGPLGETYGMARMLISLPSSELEWTLGAVRGCGGGRCDTCSAVRSIVVGLRHPPHEAVVAEFRRTERLTADFVSAPGPRVQIARLADLLMERGTLDGDLIESEFGPRCRALEFPL